MKIATVLFTYNRSTHVEAVLSALKENYVLPQKLYIFQDGMKENTNRDEWKKVGEIISVVDWCEKEIHIAETNKGLASSIIDGLDYVFEQNDAVIVLEDDCVPHPLFMSYTVDALMHYQDSKKVYSISGWAWPVEVEANGTDVYATKRISSKGWATWKDRWNFFDRDYQVMKRIKKSDYLNKQFHIWGEDLESYLLGNISGRCDSWAVFWALNVIEQDGYCISPYESLIEDIGYDGSGVHCGKNKIETRCRLDKELTQFIFEDSFEITEEMENNFSDFFAWTSSEIRNGYYYNLLTKWVKANLNGKRLLDYFKDREIDNICIWGKGKICDLILNEIEEKVHVLSIIESKPFVDEYMNIRVVDIEHVPAGAQMILIIPGYDKARIKRKIEKYGKIPSLCLEEILENIIQKGE